ncbi:MAG: alpha-galactosidase [Sedimentisphaerales bacterium]|jgi:alpha-galactosidase|nr:alpha-galactosidase [Sedimentisphaerales bacterium]HNY79605.1 alpha-galactosidase [Sedimentisphaerales bacterium]HOC65442.1 alpha-galactosidase [Sedimentisphaerales bacterium]HOH65552.1 alpha-galactosidase [Sedimentisphaerales bacterium]HPY50955.1 alpha-galactosidase [Sedimentisphaerales bacterium]
MSKPKIAMIGAGSLIFCKTLVMDILATEALGGSEICLMNRTRPKLAKMEAFVKKVIRENRLPAKVTATLNRCEALDGADYVINMIQIGGVEAFRMDYEIPLKYGVDQCIADSIGPGGIFRALRTIPVLADMAADMNELCPDAILLNYANPMGANCSALGCVADVQFIGLCHGVQTTLDLISRYVNVPKEQVDYVCAGINHMAWFLSLRDKRDGRDLYPILKRHIEKPEYYVNEKVRCEVMRHFGYFMTESTGHLSEYVPWFRGSKRALDLYCDQPDFGGASGAYYHYCNMLAEKYKKVDYLATESPRITRRSVEYCSYILEAAQTDRPFRLNGNVRNDGYITNLPQGCCVEVPVYVDSQGLHPVTIGELPVQCAALNQSNVTVQELAVEAALTGDPERAMQAVAMDPLTSAVCTLKEVRDMTAEMLEAERKWLPEFKGRKLTPRPTVEIAKGTVAVDVPLDPALAIANRFGELAK